MWSLVRTEIKYNTPIFVYIIICSVLGFLAIHFWPALSDDIPSGQNGGIIFLSLMVAYIIMAMLSNPWAKEKRTRQFMSLPVSPRYIRISHILLYALYWTLLVSTFLFYTLVSEYFVLDSATFLILCVQTGLVFIFYSLLDFVNRLPESVGRRSIEVFLLLFFIFIAIAGGVHTYLEKGDSFFLDSVLSWLYRSKLSATLWLILGFGLSFLVVRFAERASYTDS